jgi:2-aminoadipate transaminase
MHQQTVLEQPLLKLAQWTEGVERSALQQMLMRASGPDVISFALGLPAPELFPGREFSEAVVSVLTSQALALQYGPPFLPLKSHIVSLMRRRGVDCTEDMVFLTSGAQQGMSLVARLLLDSGSEVVLEECAYTGFQQILQPYSPRLLTVGTDLETGLDVDALERLFTRGCRPALVYAISDGHNPFGVSMDLAKRKALVNLAERFGVPILEDDAYGLIQYEDYPIPPLRSFNDELVFYVGSFSKILAPALRVGWIIVPKGLNDLFSIVKEAADIDTSTLSQRSIAAYIDLFDLGAHIKTLSQVYRQRRDTLLQALNTYLGPRARWSKPRSGLFMWVEVADLLDSAKLLARSLEKEKVAFIPGSAFAVNGGSLGRNALRLNFSNSPPDLIDEGIRRLARLLP